MLICGLKLTHDGAIALLDDDTLVFSVEVEKLGNGDRYSPVADLEVVGRVLAGFGYRISDVDEWVIDGWDGDRPGTVEVADQGTPLEVTVGPYRESPRHPDVLEPAVTGSIPIAGEPRGYTSYAHVSGHVACVYATSPFARRGEPSAVLIWDGGMFPRLFWVDPAAGVANGGELFPLIGHGYAVAGHHFGPFRRKVQSPRVDDLGVAGKLMAYIALGKPQRAAVDALRQAFHDRFEGDNAPAREYRRTVGGYGSMSEPSMPPTHEFFDAVRAAVERIGLSDEDVLASVHQFLEELLLERLSAKLRSWRGTGPWNLCFAGGCALNIKWNSALRAHPDVREIWVPPFPNDSGSALGVAVLGRARHRGALGPVNWSARLGPALPQAPVPPDGWTSAPCDAGELARILHETGEPVVVLNGRAELGPRALGGRSILAAAVDPAMKDELNRVKRREFYRPVAPVCLVEEAPAIFEPGTPDPHMLFEHVVRPEWVQRIPAIVHLDGTARLQTVADADDPFLAEVLRGYHRLSGIPVLCNTSANFNGRGFFPDVESAIAWGEVGRIWSAGLLYTRAEA